VDPMCGSGSILVEAALMAHNVAPGLLRPHWEHLAWPDCDRAAWDRAWAQARSECRHTWQGVIAGCDVHAVRLR
jgi:23S rRNA G2445 N2-methylase RlmL